MTKLQYDNEVFDTDACYDNSTYRFTPNKSGYYLISAAAVIYRQGGGATGSYILRVYKNGSNFKDHVTNNGGTQVLPNPAGNTIVFLNGTTDYIEIFGYGDGGGSTQTSDGGTAATISVFQASYLRS
jgi:hypothetical protein